MLLRKQKQYTRVGIDISTIIPEDIYLKLINKKSLTKDDKLLIDKNMQQFSNTIKNISKDYNSIYIFACGNFGEYNKYQKIVLEKRLSKFNIDYRRIVVCPNELIEATREFRIDALVTNKYYKGKEKVLDRILSMVTPEAFSKKIEKDKIDFTLTVPGNFKYLSKDDKKRNLSNLKGPGAGGYSLTSTEENNINNYLKKNGCDTPMLMGWGASECSATVSLEFPECRKNLSSGVPLPLTTVSVFKFGTDEELRYGEEGEFAVSGPSVMLKYLNNPEKTNKALLKHSDGKIWYHTGDIGYIDKGGSVFPTDRSDRMIINEKDGFKICPQIIEDVICQSEYIDSCIVVKYNSSKLGIVPKAFIVPAKKCLIEDTLADAKRLCIEKLSVRQIPQEYEIIEKIPYTTMGKPDYKKLEEIK